MAIALNSGNYNALNDAIIEIIKGSNYATISIFTDAAGTVLATDSHGPINNRIVLSASYTASYKDKDGNDTNPRILRETLQESSLITLPLLTTWMITGMCWDPFLFLLSNSKLVNTNSHTRLY
jgi:hypothetical protein